MRNVSTKNINGAKYLFLFENINLQKHLATNLQSAFFCRFYQYKFKYAKKFYVGLGGRLMSIILDNKKTMENIQELLEYLSGIVNGARYNIEIACEEDKENDIRIYLINNLERDFDANFITTTSILKMDDSKSSVDSKKYESRMIDLLDKSNEETMFLIEMFDCINKLDKEDRCILIKREILNYTREEVKNEMNISTNSYYKRLREAKYRLALLIPDAIMIKEI